MGVTHKCKQYTYPQRFIIAAANKRARNKKKQYSQRIISAYNIIFEYKIIAKYDQYLCDSIKRRISQKNKYAGTYNYQVKQLHRHGISGDVMCNKKK
jgi:hypothetical protein